MAQNIFNKFRKPGFTATFIVGMLSNIIVFAEPASRATHNFLAKRVDQEVVYSSFKSYSNRENHINMLAPVAKGNSELADSIVKPSHNRDNANIAIKRKKDKEENSNSTPVSTKEYLPTEEYQVYYAQEGQGAIGLSETLNKDNSRDNYFTINLPDTIDLSVYIPILTYELYGLTEASGTTKSINGSIAYGGSDFESDDTWKTVAEYLPNALLREGVNEVFFNRRSNEEYGYQIKNIGIKLYNVSNPEIEEEKRMIADVLAKDLHLVSENLEVTSLEEEVQSAFQTLSIVSLEDKSTVSPLNATVWGLPFKDIKPMDSELVNVTAGDFEGYRIGLAESPETSLELHLDFDADKIPAGYTAKDIRTYFYDKQNRSWKALSMADMNPETNTLISTLTDPGGETDYINGIIKVPEQPETANFLPTSLTDIEFANPSAGVVSIAPPSSNNMGSVGTSFPIKLPAGRNGMQPSLEVSYNSEGGNGWMGMGWDINVPSISLNTKWGVPVFDGNNESELYSLNGQDLVLKDGEGHYTNPHRDSNIRRDRDDFEEFYLRKEGSYLKIIRHGEEPNNYYWEVTDKFGNKSFYGGVGSQNNQYALKDTNGNIVHWALARQQDPYGNYVDYQYYKSSETVNGVSGWQFYIQTINYTLHNGSSNNYYQVEFNRQSGREDIMTSARNGIFQITKELLKEIKIYFVEGENERTQIRSYKFDYSEASFKKQHLVRISELDSENKLFYTNTMEYFEFDSVNNIISGPSHKWEGSNDNISSPLQNILTGSLSSHLPSGSALGTSVSDGFSFGLRVGVGIGLNPTSVSNTIGGSYSYNRNKQESRISFLDLNGDGLPDKVYANSSGVYYRPNNGNEFGSMISVTGLNRLDRSISQTNGLGFDANLFGLVGAGISSSKTKTATDNYFVDYNGDGLPDIISNNLVKFNTTQSNADNSWRSFSNNVNLSENPIVTGSLDPSVLDDLHLETIDEIREHHPQFDHVKVWRAPYSGFINISGNAALVNQNNCGENRNNEFRLTIEKTPGQRVEIGSLAQQVLFVGGSNIVLNNPSPPVPAEASNVEVTKGDLVFFRIHNKEYGCGGTVEWNPVIKYTQNPEGNAPNFTDEHNLNLDQFISKDDFILNNGGSWSPGSSDSSVQILFNLQDLNLIANEYSDDIIFTVEQIATTIPDPNNPEEIPISTVVDTWDRTYNHLSGDIEEPDPVVQGLQMEINATHSFSLRFHVTATSNIEWHKLKWKPTIESGLNTYYPPVNYITYDENIHESEYWITSQMLPEIDEIPIGEEAYELVRVQHNFLSFPTSLNSLAYEIFIENLLSSEELPIKINWVTKEKVIENNMVNVTLLHTHTFYLIDNQGEIQFSQTAPNFTPISPQDDAFFLTKQQVKNMRQDNALLYSAFYVDNRKMGVYNQAEITFNTVANESVDYPMVAQTLMAPLMAVAPAFYGLTYRGWGQFLYNGGIKYQSEDYDEDGYIIQNPNPLLYEGPIDLSVFSNMDPDVDPSQIQADIDAMNNEQPPNVDLNQEVVRYIPYNQNNMSGKFENTAIVTALFGFDDNNNLTATLGRLGEGNLYDMFVDITDILDDNGSVFIGLKQRVESKGTAVSGEFLTVSGTQSKSTSKVLNEYIDINGDRYPDIVTDDKIQFTDMRGGLSSTTIGNGFVSGGNNSDMTIGVSVASMKPNSDSDVFMENPVITNATAGINGGDGKSFNAYQWVDMNGDGLADKVIIEENSIKVWLNTGYTFSNEISWGNSSIQLLTTERGNVGVGVPIPTASFAFGVGGSGGTAEMKSSLIDVNGDGLPDLVIKNNGEFEYRLNTGTGFVAENQAQSFYRGSTIGRDFSLAANVYGAFTAGFTIPIISVKVTFSPSVGVNAAFDEKTYSVRDIDGDGLPDILYKDDNNSSIKAHLNKAGKTHLLKKVNLPLGGSWEVDYARVGNTYNMPQSKWVMKELKTYDGFTEDTNFGPNETLSKFSYENGKHDRRDRAFLGFESVKSEQWKPGGSIFRYTVQKYHNQDYYLKGALKESASFTAGDEILSLNRNFYNLVQPDSRVNSVVNTDLNQPYREANIGNLDRTRILPILVKTISTTYERDQSLSLVQEFSKYDEFGNITEYINHGSSAADAYKTVIEYDNIFKGLPTEIKVTKNTGNSNPLRHREASYNPEGKLDLVTTHLDANNTNKVEIGYDQFGNTIQVKSLDNLGLNGNPFTTQIQYDEVLHTYPTQINDSYGQESKTKYNYLFGTPVLITDSNNNAMRTRIDNRGRVIEITGPNEYNPLDYNPNWTIRNEYPGEIPVADQVRRLRFNQYLYSNAIGKFEARSDFQSPDPTNAQHHALTRHNDPLRNNNEFLTVSIIDGLGQAIQLKKTHFVDGNRTMWQVSGKEVKDAFGRVKEKYLPTIDEEYPDNISYRNGANSIPPQLIENDNRDRQIKITQPGEDQSTYFAYSIESGRFVTNITNEIGQTQETYTDIRGRQRKVIQNGEITTEFFYNAVNEQIRVRNNAGYETKYSYDMAGRRTQEQHPDRGTTNFTYDNASRLIEKQTANLMQSGNNGSILYKYDFGRLLEVQYPQHPENMVTYTYGENTTENRRLNRVGRLVQQEDATGIQRFEYGRMGELTRQERAMAVAGRTSYWFDTHWEYDSWNRISKITYPDKEEVTYNYDPAGQLQSVTTNLDHFIGAAANPNIVSSIIYNKLGERTSIEYGNGTVTNYWYDTRRRMNQIQHNFRSFQAERIYKYDALSNITFIATNNATSPSLGQLGGSVNHEYTYDNYNRLMHAEGYYVGPDDSPPDMLKQSYSLDMTYDTAHNILEKHQVHQFGSVADIGNDLPQNAAHAPSTSYKLEYSDYAGGNYSLDGQSYVQPHAPRKITEYPNEDFNGDPDDPRIRRRVIDYDADGNQLEIREQINDPTEPQGFREVSLKKHLWDAEDHLRAADLNPESDADKPLVAVYTYDASGERGIKYVPGRFDARYSAKEAGKADRLESMLYPSPLLSAKTLPVPENMGDKKDPKLISYTKHYYIGTERIASVIGSKRGLGAYCFSADPSVPLEAMEIKVDAAGAAVQEAFAHFGKRITLPPPFLFSSRRYNCSGVQVPEDYAVYWYHPDHLGSSSYITNLAGEITQHLEYLPFGETLIEEHLNSNNSPYKFNAKELDAETGNYYYGARYYDPKFSIWLSVDPLAEQMPEWSSYNYAFSNPVKFTDPTGMAPEIGDDIIFKNNKGEEIARIFTNSKEHTTVNVDTDVGLPSRIEIDARKKEGKVDAVGINFEWSYTVAGGAHGGTGFVYFLNGEDEGSLFNYDYKGGNIGIGASAGIQGFISEFNSELEFEPSVENFAGGYNGRSISALGLESSLSWSNLKGTSDQLFPGWGATNDNPWTWKNRGIGTGKSLPHNILKIGKRFLDVKYFGGDTFDFKRIKLKL